MIQINNIGVEGFQRHTVPLEDGDVILTLRFYSLTEIWQLSVEYNGVSYNGCKLSCGVLHMRSANFPFDFIVEDLSENGIDPYKSDDFFIGRCRLLMLNADEMEQIRGQEVN